MVHTAATVKCCDAAVEPLSGKMHKAIRVQSLRRSELLIEKEGSITQHREQQGDMHSIWELPSLVKRPEIAVTSQKTDDEDNH